MLDKYRYTEKEMEQVLSSVVYLVDTREKKNDHILAVMDKHGMNYKKRKLDYGDYSFMVPKNEALGIPRDLWFDKQVIIERKASLDELAGNMTKDRARLQEEFALAPPHKVLLIENASYSDVIYHNYTSKYNSKAYLSTLHAFLFRYDLPFVFMPDNKCSAVFIKYYFENYLKHVLR